MIPNYINKWLNIIENMNNDNTYKLAWGRAILECVSSDKCYDIGNDNVCVYLSDISPCMLKYYWNQIFFFNLKQSPNDKKPPVICQITNKLIDEYITKTSSNIPVWFDKALASLGEDSDEYLNAIRKILKVLPENVAWRFKNINGNVIDIYDYDEKAKSDKIILSYDDAVILKEHSIILTKLLNYKWAQLLEKFNYAPKIASKVNGISQAKLNRNSLTKYKEQLLKQFNDNPVDFYTGLPLDLDDISVDHVIPWSFMYSDDIWNLVLTTKSNNSIKSNSIPTEEIIEKLKERNLKLMNVVDSKYKNDIEESIKMNYIDKFYYESRCANE